MAVQPQIANTAQGPANDRIDNQMAQAWQLQADNDAAAQYLAPSLQVTDQPQGGEGPAPTAPSSPVSAKPAAGGDTAPPTPGASTAQKSAPAKPDPTMTLPDTFAIRPMSGGDSFGVYRSGMLVGGGADETQAVRLAQEIVARENAITLGDVGGFVTDIPMQTIGAIRDAGQGVMDLGNAVTEFTNKVAPLGAAFDGDGNLTFVHPFMDAAEKERLAALPENQRVDLPDIPDAKTEGGKFYRSVMKFVVGMKGAGKALEAVGLGQATTKGGKVAVETLKGIVGDVAVTTKDDENLSKLVEQYPFLKNPITDALATDEDDLIIERKLKGAIEGAGLGLGVQAVATLTGFTVKAVRAMKAKRAAGKAFDASPTKQQMEEAADLSEAAQAKRDILILGNPADPLTVTKEVPAVGAELMEKAAKATVQEDRDAALRTGLVGDGIMEPAVPMVKKLMPNFARINAEGDIEAILQDMAAKNESAIAAAKGGVVTRAQTHAAGKELGIEELLQMDPAKTGITAARLDAMKDFYAASGTLLRETAGRATAAPTDANLFAFRKAMTIHAALLEKFTAARAEAGRALNILGRMSDAGDRENLKGMQDFLESMGGREAAKEIASKIAATNLSNEALNKIIEKGWGAKTADAFFEAWTLGLVSGVRTQGRNILSNFAVAAQNVMNRGVAARLPNSEVEKGEALMMMGGYLYSAKQAFINSGKAFWEGTSGYGIGKVDLPHRKAIVPGEWMGLEGNARRVADSFGELWRVWGRALSAGDEFFKTINYQGEMWAQAFRVAKQSGKTGEDFYSEMALRIANPTEDMRLASREAAERGTFTQSTGKVAGMIQAAKMDDNLAVSIPARFIFPFVKTVSNITRGGLSYTPLAATMPKTFWAEINKGGAARDIALSKLAIGSTTMALWSDLVMRGEVTGNGPSQPEDRAAWRAAGYEPYSVKIGGKWYSYRPVEPIGMVMGMSADVTEKMLEYSKIRDSDDPEAEKKMEKLAVALVAATGNSLTSQSFSRGLSELFTVMSNPDMYGDRYLEHMAASLVPKIIPSVYEMAGVTGTDEWKDVAGAMDAIDAQIRPWAALPMRDVFGEVRKKQPTFPSKDAAAGVPLVSPMMKFAAAASPIYTGDPAAADPIEKEIYNQQIGISRPSKAQSFRDPNTGIRAPMDLGRFPKVYDRMQELTGTLKHPAFDMTLKEFLNSVVEGTNDLSEVYKMMPDGDEQGIDNKGAFIKGWFGKYREMARDAIMQDDEFEPFHDEIRKRAERIYTKQFGGQP